MTENFSQVEPLLIQELDTFKTEFKEVMESKLQGLIDAKFDHIDRVEKFINHRSKIGTILNDEWVDQISLEFEDLAQSEYSKIYRKYTNDHGKIMTEFKKIKSESFVV